MAADSPFTPQGAVTDPSLFVGRLNEINSLLACLKKTKTASGGDCHRTITGVRGIGKTSLLNYIGKVAEGTHQTKLDRFRFLLLSLSAGTTTTGSALLSAIGAHLTIALDKENYWKALGKKTWDFLKKFKVGGIEYKDRPPETTEPNADNLLNELAAALAEAATKLPDRGFDGILVTIDEADMPEDDAILGQWLRRLVEHVKKLNCNNFLVFLAGLPRTMLKLEKAHPSAPRVFLELPLDRLPDDDIEQLLDLYVDKANRSRKKPIELTTKAKELLVELSDGYPHFLQTFGDVVWSQAGDTGDTITDDDVVRAATDPNDGGILRIGNSYGYRTQYGEFSPCGKEILRFLARSNGRITDDAVAKRMSLSCGEIASELQFLLTAEVIESSSAEGRQAYRITDTSFAYWVQLFAEKKGKQRHRRHFSGRAVGTQMPGDLEELRELLREHGIDPRNFADLEAALQQDQNSGQPYGPATKAWLAKMAARSAAAEVDVDFDFVGGELREMVRMFAQKT